MFANSLISSAYEHWAFTSGERGTQTGGNPLTSTAAAHAAWLLVKLNDCCSQLSRAERILQKGCVHHR